MTRVRSTAKNVVYALGLNLVVICLRVQPAWGGTLIAIAINMRLHRKKDSITTVAHAAAMATEIAVWFSGRALKPDRRRCLRHPGPGPAGRRAHQQSDARDAALFAPAPPSTGRRGRPRTKGDRAAHPTRTGRPSP